MFSCASQRRTIAPLACVSAVRALCRFSDTPAGVRLLQSLCTAVRRVRAVSRVAATAHPVVCRARSLPAHTHLNCQLSPRRVLTSQNSGLSQLLSASSPEDGILVCERPLYAALVLGGCIIVDGRRSSWLHASTTCLAAAGEGT